MPSTAAAPVAAPAPAPAASKNSLLAPKQTWDEQFAATDFSDKEAIIALFPSYMQETIAIRKANKKGVTNAINIECFTLKTPFGDQTLLKNTKLIIENNKRLGLVGANCTGKTLLFNNISERLIKEVPKHLHIHHCKEFESHELHDSVLNTVVNGYPYRRILIACEAKLRGMLAADPAPAGELKEKLEANLEFIVMSMKSIRGYDAEERAAKMLRVLGFDDIGMKKLVSALSGGLRMRVALCLAFFIEADLLLLDEPTNHLDFPSVLWLENRLRGYKGSFVMVSHDRELLNNVCQSVMLLEDKLIKYYNMGFKEFEKKKAEEDKKKSDEIEKFLKKNPNADPSTPLGKEKAEKKEWMDNYNRKQVALAGKFTFPVSVPLDNTEVGADGQPINPDDIALIDLKDVRFSYNVETGHFIFNDPISFKVTATTRVGVMGPNGAGKSTLLKLLTHKLVPTSGTVTHHPKFNLAYFGQHSTAELNLEMTAIEFMQSQFPEEKAGNLRSHLAKTSIVGPVADTRIKSLSFSQRSCVIFAKLTYVAPHLLILDEPTNFLDLESVDALIMACNKYKGALLLVSHNRDFLKKCAKQYLSVVPGQFKLFDRLKEAENATYSFIAEMEEGVKVGAGDLVKKNPGGGSVHDSQKTDGDEKKAAAGPKVITFGASNASTPLPKYNAGGSATPAPKPAAAPAKDAPKNAAAAPAAKKDAAAAPAAAAPAADGAAPAYAADEKVQALWKDGKWYAAVIKKVNAAKGDYTVLYTEYGNTTNLSADKIRKLPAPAAKKQ